MKMLSTIWLAFLLVFASRAAGQEAPSNDEFAPFVLVRIIPMPDVEGRFDHMGVDEKAIVYSPPFTEMTARKFTMLPGAEESC